MDWCEIKVTVPSEETEAAEAVASLFADGGLYTEDYSRLEEQVEEIAHIDLIDEKLVFSDREHSVIHIYVSPEKDDPSKVKEELSAQLDAAGISFMIDEETVREEDWANGWRRFYKPSPVGEKLYILPEWEKPDHRAHGRKILKLDPGAAFGTGSHETTRLCLTVLEKYAEGCPSVLDVGCGSGILSIACVILGAKRAVGVDIDPVAVRVAKENAALNGVEDKVEFLCGDLTEKVSGRFSLVAANIVADVIKRLLPSLPDLMEDGAAAVFSGIIDSREDEVAAAVKSAGLSVTGIFRDRGWCAVEAVKKAGEGE